MRLVWRLYDEFMEFPVTMGWYKKVDLNSSIPAARNGGRSRAGTASVSEAESPDLDLRYPGVRLCIPCNASSGNVLEVGRCDCGAVGRCCFCACRRNPTHRLLFLAIHVTSADVARGSFDDAESSRSARAVFVRSPRGGSAGIRRRDRTWRYMRSSNRIIRFRWRCP